jgi:hypothetical protein
LKRGFEKYRQLYPADQGWILEYIEIAHPAYYYAFEVPILEGEVIVGRKGKAVKPTYLLNRWISGRGAGIFKNEPHVLEASAIWMSMAADRKAIKDGWVDEMLVNVVNRLSDRAQGYNDLQHQIDQKFAERDLSIIQNKRIIACTTTGAAKFRESIATARPGILVVEEAGEILESHILTALSAETEQVILIGDHKLRFQYEL